MFLKSLLLALVLECCLVKAADDSSPLEVVVSRLTQDVAEMKAEMQALKTETQALKTAAGHKAALHARHPPHPILPNAPIKFQTDAQVGGGYDQNTGIFTAPFSGWYTIHARLFSRVSADFSLDILINNGIINRAYCKENHFFTCTSDATLHMNSGDKIWIQTDANFEVWDADFDNMLSIVLAMSD